MHGRTLLVIGENTFITRYVASVLTAREAIVVSADLAGGETERLIDTGNVAAAAIGATPAEKCAWQVARSLVRRDIPFVVLADRPGVTMPSDLRNATVMTWPFAAHQVADAITLALDVEGGSKPPRTIMRLPNLPG